MVRRKGREYLYMFRTDSPAQVVRIKPDVRITAVHIASNNLIAMGDSTDNVQIYDVSAGNVISKQKACENPAGAIELNADTGYLWVASSFYNPKSRKREKGEIALYHLKGLERYSE